MRHLSLRLVIVSFLLALGAPCAASDAWMSRDAFDALDQRYRSTSSARAEDASGMAWGRSYALMAYVAMYRATDDRAYLLRLLEEAESIASLRDDRRQPPLEEQVRGRVVPAWSTARYTKDRRYAWAVHTGMITAPILEGLWLARHVPSTEGAFSEPRRAALLTTCREAIDVHADQWRDGPRAGEGHLVGLTLKKHLPLNQQSALGRAYVWLYRLTGEAEYRRRAEALLRALKNRLRRDGEAYVWAYWPPLEGPGSGFEDISHGAINVDFACLGARAGWVFDEQDIARFRRTLLGKVMRSENPADTVGGTGTSGKRAAQVGRWLALAARSAEVWKRIHDYFDRHRPRASSTDLLTLALLLRYRRAPLESIQPLLHEGEAYVALSEVGKSTIALVVTREGTAQHTLAPLADIASLERRLTDPEQDGAAALKALSAHLVEPLGLGDVDRVLVSPHGALSFLPYPALVGEREVACVPSTEAYLRLVEERAKRGTDVLAVGDPDPTSSARIPAILRSRRFVRLPGARKEAEAVGDRVLLGREATEGRLAEALKEPKRWRAVHFACHSVVEEARPFLSALVLTPDGSNDGFLTCLELMRMEIEADLVVLSASDTARGRVVDKEGVIGLTRAFMSAGVPRVLCSLWKVDDEATRALMVKFYELWHPKTGEGMGAAAALRTAQAHVRSHEKWKHPYYWAAWVLWGLPE